jgi:DNA-binding transcriptional regulator YiaG
MRRMASTALAETTATSKPDYSRLSQEEIVRLFNLHKAGLSQPQIAQELNCSQKTVSRWLQDFIDTTEPAKVYLRGNALRMAQNIVKKGRAVDHVAALKGLSVLHEEQQSGVTVIVGGGGTVNIGVLSPAKGLE